MDEAATSCNLGCRNPLLALAEFPVQFGPRAVLDLAGGDRRLWGPNSSCPCLRLPAAQRPQQIKWAEDGPVDVAYG